MKSRSALILSCAVAATATYTLYAETQDATEAVSIETVQATQYQHPAKQSVRLSGQLIEKISGNVYILRDKTGTIRVEIEPHEVPASGLQLNKPVSIEGQVETSPEQPVLIDAESVSYRF